MKNLRHVNIDHLHVGWYQSTNFGTYVNKALVDSQFNYQFSIEESIVLIYGKFGNALSLPLERRPQRTAFLSQSVFCAAQSIFHKLFLKRAVSTVVQN